MAKPEWGQKRTCSSCSCRFYDMAKTPVICPKCGATVEIDVPLKGRRAAAAAAAAAVARSAAVAKANAENAAIPEDDEEGLETAEEGGEEDESGLIEDTSDLGGDDDDMAEVMDHMDAELSDEV